MTNEEFITALERAEKLPVDSIVVVSEPQPLDSQTDEIPRIPFMIMIESLPTSIDATRYLDEYAQLTGARHVALMREPVLFWDLPLSANASKEATSTLTMLNKNAKQSKINKMHEIIQAWENSQFGDDHLMSEYEEIPNEPRNVLQAYRTVVENKHSRLPTSRPYTAHERREMMSACEKLVRAARSAKTEVSRLLLTVVN